LSPQLGVGWASTILGAVGILLLPSPFLFYKYGARIRANSKYAPCLDLKVAKAVAAEAEAEAQGRTVKTGTLANDPGHGKKVSV
jgi:hypothetical protein